MKTLLAFLLFSVVYITTYAQKPKDGTYTYAIAFAEWGGKSMGETCIVVIKGDRIKVIYDGRGHLTLTKKDDVLDRGIIMRHTKTGKWIIGHNAKDKNAKDIGGCSDGPTEIDFKKKLFWIC